MTIVTSSSSMKVAAQTTSSVYEGADGYPSSGSVKTLISPQVLAPMWRIEIRGGRITSTPARIDHRIGPAVMAADLVEVAGLRDPRRLVEAADMLNSSQDSVNSALIRARAAIHTRVPAGQREHAPLPNSPRERALLRRFTDAFQAGNIDNILALLTDDAWATMPPLPVEYQGHDKVSRFLATGVFAHHRRFQLIATRANTQPAFGLYQKDPQSAIARAHGLIMLTLEGDQISAITRFLDNSILPPFRLPRALHT